MDVPEFPQRVEVELSSQCNLSCSYCPRHHIEELGGFIDPTLFKKIIDEISSYKDRIVVLHRRGESLLHPNFVQLLRYCKGKFNEVQIATNGTIMNPEIEDALLETLGFISFSIDLPENVKRTRGIDYHVLEKNIMSFLKKNNGKVKTQVSLVKTEEISPKEVRLFTDLWNERVDRVRIYEEHSKDGNFGSLEREREGRKPCVMPFYEMLIFYDGKVGRCNHDWNGTPIGDVSKASLLSVWEGASLTDLRDQHLTLNISDETCKECGSWYPAEKDQGTGLVIEAKKENHERN